MINRIDRSTFHVFLDFCVFEGFERGVSLFLFQIYSKYILIIKVHTHIYNCAYCIMVNYT